MAKIKIKAGDTVLVRAGKDKGLEGKVLKVYPDSSRILVEGVNRVVRHQRVTPGQGGAKQGGLITKEAAVHISNVMLVGPDKKPIRVGFREVEVERDGRKKIVRERIGRRGGKEIEL